MGKKSEEYKKHRIELRESEGRLMLFIDKKPVHYGQLPDGRYFLNEYAFDWGDDLLALARRYIDHQNRVGKIREQSLTTKKGGK
jgi:hypothetical protein